MAESSDMDGKFYHFTPTSKSNAKSALGVSNLYRQHPVIVLENSPPSGEVKGMVWVVTATSHPHLEESAANYIPIDPTPTNTSSYENPLAMKKANMVLPKKSWVVLDSCSRIPKNVLEPMMQKLKGKGQKNIAQYALHESSLQVLRDKTSNAVREKEKQKKLRKQRKDDIKAAGQADVQAKRVPKVAAQTSITGFMDKGKGRATADHQVLTELDLKEIKNSVVALEVRLVAIEGLFEKLNTRVNELAIHPVAKPSAMNIPLEEDVQENSSESDAESIARETVTQMRTSAGNSSSHPTPVRKRDSMKRVISQVWSKMPGTSSPSIEEKQGFILA